MATRKATKPATKFMFDTIFEPDDEMFSIPGPRPDELVPEDPVVEEEPPAPTFSQEELDAVREEAFTVGRDQGIQEATNSIEQHVAAILDAIARDLPQLFRIQDESLEVINANALAVAGAIARKLAPDLARRNGLGEVTRLVETTLTRILEEPRVMIRVSDALASSLRGRVETLVANVGFEGRMSVLADAALDVGDCRIEWSAGGADRDMAALVAEVDQIVARNLGPSALVPEPSHDKYDTDGGIDGNSVDGNADTPNSAGTGDDNG